MKLSYGGKKKGHKEEELLIKLSWKSNKEKELSIKVDGSL